MVNYYMKVNIQMEKETEKEKNIIIMENYYMKENLKMEGERNNEKFKKKINILNF